jgi:DNA-binding Xre family transcriptional regulator
MSMSDRLADLLEVRRVKAVDLARSIGVTRQTVYWLLDGTTTVEKVRAKTLHDIARQLGTSIEYILTGHGPRDIARPDAALEEIAQHYREATETARHALLTMSRALVH